MFRIATAMLAALLLSGCIFGGGGGSSNDDSGSSSGGGSGGSGSSGAGSSSGGGFSVPCDAITGGGSQVSAATSMPCNNCSSADNGKAADGNLESFATATVGQSLPTSGVSLRATAQPGIVFPAGSKPGAYTHVPDNSPSYNVTIRTFLAGTQQESVRTDSSSTDSDALTYFTFVNPATQPFDAVEVLFSNQQPLLTDTATLQILEICSDGGVSLP